MGPLRNIYLRVART
jgi:hypothetical protein